MKKTHLLLLKQNVNKMMTFVLEELDVIRMTIIVTTPAVVLMKRRMMMSLVHTSTLTSALCQPQG